MSGGADDVSHCRRTGSGGEALRMPATPALEIEGLTVRSTPWRAEPWDGTWAIASGR